MAKKEGGKGGKKKGGASPGGFVDTRKPKHSKDANRPSKSDKGMRDAATVSLWARMACWHCLVPAALQHGSLVHVLCIVPGSCWRS